MKRILLVHRTKLSTSFIIVNLINNEIGDNFQRILNPVRSCAIFGTSPLRIGLNTYLSDAATGFGNNVPIFAAQIK